MTAITTSQLDELEQRAKAAQHTACAPVRYFRHPDAPMAVAWSPVIDGRDTCVPQSYADCYRKVDADFVTAADPVTIARLVAIARAALALPRGVSRHGGRDEGHPMTVDRTALRRLYAAFLEEVGPDHLGANLVAAVPLLLDELDAKDRRIAELEADVVAADERMAGVLDGTFSVGDGTAQAEIERCRARIAELEHIEAAYEKLRDELGGANASLLVAGDRIADLELQLSIATELNVGDRKRIAELEAKMAERDKAVAQGYLDLGTANQRIHALEAGLREAIRWIADRSSDHSIFINRLSKLVSSEET